MEIVPLYAKLAHTIFSITFGLACMHIACWGMSDRGREMAFYILCFFLAYIRRMRMRVRARAHACIVCVAFMRARSSLRKTFQRMQLYCLMFTSRLHAQPAVRTSTCFAWHAALRAGGSRTSRVTRVGNGVTRMRRRWRELRRQESIIFLPITSANASA